MAAIYLGAAALDRRRAAWVAFLVGFVVLAAGRLLDSSFGPSLVLLVGALAFFVLGVVRGQWRTGGGLRLRPTGSRGSGAAALRGLSVIPTLGGFPVAAPLFGTPPGMRSTFGSTG